MPTGPTHTFRWEEVVDGTEVTLERVCRCMHGEDHHSSDDQGYSWDEAGNMYEDGEPM